MCYEDFFEQVTGFKPYPYQEKVATQQDFPVLMRIPTGAGKTEAAILGWLYRHFFHPDPRIREATPRRLVYCLPMRTLVEQTVGRIRCWLKGTQGLELDVVTLMGGEPRIRWDLHPEKPCILVGTQDMLLSRALNRGYGISPYMWPVEYGLLNNDCLWVLDEVQLMANGLATSTQLSGLREKLKTFGPTCSVWMSATVEQDWLETIDHARPEQHACVELGPKDLADRTLQARHYARKVVTQADTDVESQGSVMELITEKHIPGTLTLVIVNRVERAQKVYQDLASNENLTAETLLIHSRFRQSDRQAKNDRLMARIDPDAPGRIVVATQAVEAGVDVSARTLITELAPWPSLVQRFGRCNRKGEYEAGHVWWMEPDTSAPYEADDLEPARHRLKGLQGKSVGPADLIGFRLPDPEHRAVVRRRDVLGLFDTVPDLSGNHVDVSQYVRGADTRDVSVFWREMPDGEPGEQEPRPRHHETVSVPMGGQRNGSKGILDYLKQSSCKAWVWDTLDGYWRSVQGTETYPGMTLMLNARQGGYSSTTGWDPACRIPVDVESPMGLVEDDQSADPGSIASPWVTLIDHTQRVVDECRAVTDGLSSGLDLPVVSKALMLAARYHDLGKAHPTFQAMLRDRLPEGASLPPPQSVMAKSPGRGKHERRHFRHEMGSALSILQHVHGEPKVRDLAAYLAAAHHGKIRLGIRSLPGRRRGTSSRHPDPHFLLGYNTDVLECLPAVNLGEVEIPETVLDMSIAQVGLNHRDQRSWLERSLNLLEWLGPFRLAYLEALMRAADARVSQEETDVPF